MRGFRGGAELGLTKEDLAEVLEYVLNKKILRSDFRADMEPHKVDKVSLHPNNKYVARITFSPRDQE